MRSTRLPGKILLPLPIANGKPLLLWIVEQLRKSVFAADIWLATSVNEENDVLEQFCKEQGLFCFRGDEEDVLSRFIEITKRGTYDTLVRLTADNPVLDIELLDKCLLYHIDQKNDYTKTSSLPVGMNFEIVAARAILSTVNAELQDADKEHVTLFIRNSDGYKKEEYLVEVPAQIGELRLTVDYPSDLLVASTVLSFAQETQKLQGLGLIKHIWENYPFVFEANVANFQKKQFKKPEEEIAFARTLLQEFDLHQAARALEKNEKKDII